MRYAIHIAIFLVVMANTGEAVAQRDARSGKSIPAIHAAVPPQIDGRLDDMAWQSAAIIDDLHVVSPNEGGTPSEQSRFYVTYGDDALYVGADFRDSEPHRIIANVLRQGDYSEGDDGVTVILDPFNQGRSGYAFYLMPNAVRAEALYKNVTEENWDWEGIWHGATRIGDDGWTAEIEIPFKTLSFDPGNDTWGINFSRYIGRRQEEIGWVSHNRRQDPSSSGKLTGLRGLQQGLGLDVVPAVAVSERRDFAAGTTVATTEPSIDVYYKPTPALTAALTLNTDFSGTSADFRQVNLTRFSLFFPEKRSFFLQDMDIFEFGLIGSGGVQSESARPFFSRRIGLSDSGEAIDIDGGMKLTGRIGRWDYGILGVRQDAFGTTGATNLAVARVSANVLAESSLGVIATYGDPQSNADNALLGVDFRYLNTRLANGKTLVGSAWYQQTDTPGLDRDDAAFGFSLAAPNSEGWNGALSVREVQANFRPALGFVNLANVRSVIFDGAYIWRPASDVLRLVRSGIDGRRVETIGGALDNAELNFNVLRLENHSGDYLSARYMTTKERLTAPFEISRGVVLPRGAYQWGRVCLEMGTGNHRRLSFFTWACEGEFYDGTRGSYGPEFVWRPNKHLAITTSYSIDFIDLPQGSFTTRQIILQADVAFSASWYWENLVQYDNVSDSLGVNSIMRWVPKAGTELLVVVNREFVDPLERQRFHSSFAEMVLKFDYTFRF